MARSSKQESIDYDLYYPDSVGEKWFQPYDQVVIDAMVEKAVSRSEEVLCVQEFITLLLCCKRIGIKLPQDVRKLLFFEHLKSGSIELKGVDLSRINLAERFEPFVRTTKLHLSGTQIQSADFLFELPLLVELVLDNNYLTGLPWKLELPRLERLSMAENGFIYLPPEPFDCMTRLQYLCLADNQLEVLPKNLLDRPSVSHVDLSCNSLWKLPKKLGHGVKWLSLRANNLESIEEDFFTKDHQVNCFSVLEKPFQLLFLFEAREFGFEF